MLTIAEIALLIHCAEPRMDYRAFFEATQHVKYPGHSPDTVDHVISRAMTVVADYVDYVEAYKDKCNAR